MILGAVDRRTLLAALAAPVIAPAGARAAAPSPLFGPDRGIDHIMLWTRNIDRAVPVLRDSLGFNVGPGGTFPDSANMLIRLADGSYLEVLYALPKGAPTADLLAYVPFLAKHDGSNAFAFRVDSLEAAGGYLAEKGFDLEPPAASEYDPDGPGPRPVQPSLFRTLEFKAKPLPGLEPFLVWYAPPSEETLARRRAGAVHANTATGLTAIWLLSADFAASRAALIRMGMTAERTLPIPFLQARGQLITGGGARVVLIDPGKQGFAAAMLEHRGPHIMGVSLAAQDLETARTVAGKGFGEDLKTYGGPFGRSFIAPSYTHLGVFFDFHQA